ncbi:MAG TPA: DsbA family oxidoreductase [Candidatus Binataceae bacterium]|nr:DsbA family oxidoreductase [Candidatus Binataceae bacterium]
MDISIDIVSDVVCPWCFIGKRRLEKALAQLEGQQVRITWRPFELNPDMPRGGMDRDRYVAAKFGGPERAKEIYQRITEAGASEGLGFRYDLIAKTPNTFDAHRLLWMAEWEGDQNALSEALFRAYFVEGKDVGDRATLAALAASAGIDAVAAELFLESEQAVDQVRAEELLAQKLGVSGVPFFILNGRYALSGAQDSQLMLSALKRVVDEQAEPARIFQDILEP